jgi:hypothetical protein
VLDARDVAPGDVVRVRVHRGAFQARVQEDDDGREAERAARKRE